MDNIKKSLMAVMLCAFLALSSAACGENSSDDSSSKDTPAFAESSLTESTAETDESSKEDTEDSSETSEEESEEESEETSEEESAEESKEESSRSDSPADESWFDDAIFIGDSVTQGLCNYVEDQGGLGDADFLCIDCMGYHTAMFGLDHEYGIHPVYNGQKVMIDDAVQEIGKTKVFINLGMNDIASWGVDETVDAFVEFTDQLLAKSPNIHIYFESVIPAISTIVREDYLNNENIVLFNAKVKEICEEKGYTYIDLYAEVQDEYGNLRYDLCIDPNGLGHHLTYEGLQMWIDLLKRSV